mmetsp:Transcript_107729/g.214069  ORF Transcript_107729/g.214069 Transcript_107729/m.214069 type:complete len:129 (+) Transcript_107729:277-663(+)
MSIADHLPCSVFSHSLHRWFLRFFDQSTRRGEVLFIFAKVAMKPRAVKGASEAIPPIDHGTIIGMKILVMIVMEFRMSLPEEHARQPQTFQVHPRMIHCIADEDEKEKHCKGEQGERNRDKSGHSCRC